MIEINNLVLAKLSDFQVGEVKTTKKELDTASLAPIPIVLQVGSVRYKFGIINTVTVGREAITGDLHIFLKGSTEMEVVDGIVCPKAYVFRINEL